MRRIIFLLCPLFLMLFSNGEAQGPGMRFNGKGWNMPDTKELILVSAGAHNLPGIEKEVRTERWELPKDSSYRIIVTYPGLGPVSEEVGWMVIYRTPDENILCFEYGRLIREKKSGQTIGGTLSFIADLDNDGRYESQFDGDGGIKDKQLLTSIIRLKLGISEETDIMLRIIKAALLESRDPHRRGPHPRPHP